ncbi:MAG: C25 family cysteine peptidase [bacterium]
MFRTGLTIVLALLMAPAAATGAWTGRVSFSPGSFEFSTPARDGEVFDFVSVRPDYGPNRSGLAVVYPAEPGEPLLPAWLMTLVIPQGMRVASVTALPGRVVELPGRFRLMPAQLPVPVSVRELPAFVPLDADIAGSDEAWPAVLAAAGPVGNKSGFRLVTITLNPLRYHARSGRLELATELSLRVEYEPDPAARPELLSERQLARFAPAVRALVHNPAEVNRYAPMARPTDFGDIDCVILTSAALEPAFARLADWHTRKGFRTETRTTTWVYANYAGRDNPERIRNFVRDYHTNQGLMWLILGGDNAVVPARRARAVVNSSPGDIPCDLYYADLQWSWDGNNNNIFGEAGVDTVDLYYDLYVGRASVDDTVQVNTFVDKVLTHEQNPPTDYLRRMLLADAELWSGYNHQQSNDSIAAITPAGWTDVFIHSPTNTTAIRDSLNHGFQFAHIVGHGNDVGIYNGSTNMYGNAAAGAQTNAARVNLLNSIACYPGNFEYSDCLAEVAHNRRGGGSVAVIMNSRYGWGQPPNLGPSEKLDIRFYDYFFNHDTMPIGITHAASKEFYRSLALNQQVWRWCYYELNLFADPLLMMYEDIPGSLALEFDSPIMTGGRNYTVTVRSGGSALAGALVCLQKGAEVYARGWTNGSGQVTLAINPATAGWLQITATAANHLPEYDSCQVLDTFRDVAAMRVLAPSGSILAGTTVAPQALVKNLGTATELNVPVRFRIGAGYSDTRSIASLAPGDSAVVNFVGWTAGPVGGHLGACSTALVGDMLPANDTASLGFSVYELRDVGVTAILAPAGTLDSGATVTPQARVRNHGSVAAAFPVICRIGAGYADTALVGGLNPGDSTVVSFASWTATGAGPQAVACSTALANDTFPANDRLVDSVFVASRDAEVIAILSPTGTFDSTGVRAVQARVRNNGNTAASFPVVFRITGPAAWSDTAQVSNLGPGSEATVNFANWPIGPRGSYTAACSTRLAGDANPANNRLTGGFTVRIRDAAAIGLASPPAVVDSGSVVPVRAIVANYGSVASDIGVRVSLGSYYTEQTTATIGPNTLDTVALPDWQVLLGRGSWPTVCSVWVASDIDPGNNVFRGQLTVAVRDAGVTELLAPSGRVDSGTVVTPRARVRNHGNLPETFPVRFVITDGYGETRTVSLPPDTDTVLAFSPWTAGTPGEYAVSCSTRLPGDMRPANDRRTGSVNVAGTDVGVTAIIAPGPGVMPGPLEPAGRWRNYSMAARDFTAFIRVFDSAGSPIYEDQAAVSALEPDSAVEVVFSLWDAATGNYTVRCSTWCDGDRNPSNDTAARAFRVFQRDVGVEAIVSPIGNIRPLPISPVVRVANPGEATEEFWCFLTIVDTVTGREMYFDSAFVTGVNPGQSVSRSLPGWVATVGYFQLTAWTALPGDDYPANDTARARVNCTPGALGWEVRADLPPGTGPARHGACLTAIETDSTLIYCLKGNKTRDFFAYRVAERAWTPLADIPPGPSARPVRKGAAMTTDRARYVYALKGNRTHEFWRYDTREDAWEQLADLPAGARRLGDGAGLGYVVVGDSGFVYCLKSSKTTEFYRYSVESETWQAAADAPAGLAGRGFAKGSAFCAGAAGLYALRGRYNEFSRYDPALNRWTGLAGLPDYSATGRRNRAKDGCALAGDGRDVIYAFAGGNRQWFFGYSEALDRWTELESLPRGPSRRRVKSGASLAQAGLQTWAIKGNKTNEFWVYTPDTMEISGVRPEPAEESRPGRDGVMAGPLEKLAPGILLGPNPARGEISLFAGNIGGEARVELVSALGTVLVARALPPRAGLRIPVGHLPAGSYFIRVRLGETELTRKVVISR